MTSLPPLAPLPPPQVQSTIPSQEWELYLDAWILLLGARLESPGSEFKHSAPKDESSVVFLTSFYHQLATVGTSGFQNGPRAKTLRKFCFLLTRRFLLEAIEAPAELLEWRYLGEMCCCYPSSSAMKKLLSDIWSKHEDAVVASLEKIKARIIKQLSTLQDSTNLSKTVSDIRLLTVLASSLPVCGQVLMAGSDFLDTLADVYQAYKRDDVRKSLVAIVYVGLTSLLKGPKPNLSLLLDQLFGLKASIGVGTPTAKREATILSDVICSSDLLTRLERYLSTNPQKRGQDLISSLRSYQLDSRAHHHRYQKQKKRVVDKGKGRAITTVSPTVHPDLHIHKMSLITQIQDLFPDLGSGYIIRLLDFYNDEPETIISHLLDSSIAPELLSLDQSEPLPDAPYHDPMPPHSTPPPPASPPSLPTEARKNVFDNDIDLAELARSKPNSKSSLRLGRANPALTADDLLSDRTHHAANKAAIISALATFDSDDDERDDTYDVADVGGTVDTLPDGGDSDTDAAGTSTTKRGPNSDNNPELDLILFRAYQSNKSLFGRDSATRRSQPRGSLKRETGMTDEAIEGWAVMLERDPKRLAKLENMLTLGGAGGGAGGGISQPELHSTAYRRPNNTTADDDGSETDSPSSGPHRGRGGGGGAGSGRGRGAGGGRGRGRGFGTAAGRGRGGGDQNTGVSRQRKEENKASKANHNRRAQRAKKVARAGGMVG